MKRSLAFLFLTVISAHSADVVDLVHDGSALYVVWGCAVRIWGTGTERVFSSEAEVTLGMAELSGQQVLLCTRCHVSQPDSIYVLDSSSLEVIASRRIDPEDLADLSLPPYASADLRLARHQPETGCFFISADPGLEIPGYLESNAVSARLQYSPEEGIVIADTLGAGRVSTLGRYFDLTGPVFSGSAPPMVFWSYWETYYYAYLAEYAGIHIQDGPPVQGNYEPILFDSIYHASGVFTQGGIKCSGASGEEVVVIWSREDDQDLSYSVFDCTGVQPVEEGSMPGSPGPDRPMTLSRNPQDQGMLLVWADSSSVRCRYRENGCWNPWIHTVDSIGGELVGDCLRASGTPQGYWLAWLVQGSAEPEVRFVPRGTVTGIGHSEGNPLPQFTVIPNPCLSSVPVHLTGPEGGEVLLFDLKGRLIEEIRMPGTGTAVWDTGHMGPGVYPFSIQYGTDRCTGKLTILR